MSEATVSPHQRSATVLDQFVSRQLKLLREQQGLSQVSLAEMMGISFQQLQKYERGINRISAGRLFELSQLLGVDISYFFQGAEPLLPQRSLSLHHTAQAGLSSSASLFQRVLQTKGSNRLLTAFVNLKSEAHKKKAIELLELLE
jgi:transcriptional regulator with XRE-family HTH domain